MKHGKLLFATVCFLLPLSCFAAFAGEGILLEVTAGKADVTDWVAEATLDLAAARSLLGVKGRPDRIAVYEVDASGSAGARVSAQVDSAGGKGLYTVAWRVPGELAAGARRSFVVRFEGGAPLVDERAIIVVSSPDAITVANGDILLDHTRGAGGMIGRVTVAGASASLSWADKIFDGTVYYLANHSAERMEVAADGPLRAVIETEGAYTGGKGAPSKPRAAYRFTTYAGLPFALVEADVTQNFAHQWRSLHFIEMQIGAAGFTHVVTDKFSGALKQAGKFSEGSEWAAVYNEKLLLATCASQGPGVWDGGGGHYGAYLRAGTAPMTTLRYPWKAAIVFAPGRKALEDKTVQRWSAILADPPAVSVSFDKLGLRVAQAAQAVRERETSVENLTGSAWATTHVAVTLARQQADIARERLRAGAFRESLDAIRSCRETLDIEAQDADVEIRGAVQAGVVMGHPFLANGHAAFLWSKGADGSGLMSIFDRKSGREILKARPSEATLWEIAVKQARGGKTYTNVGARCTVTREATDEEGRLEFRWSGDVDVELSAHLAAGDALLRCRLSADTESDTAGLVTVTFPLIAGVAPLTEGARGDSILETWGLGWQKPSPLVTGKVSSTNYPRGMQFTALLGDARGIYFAEEDGDANRKEITWTPDANTQTLTFSISHPVLNWGAEKPVREYESPGDVVCGPFQGDWYDAARIYRKWALTAPWCAKGPIYEREDYPQWLAKAPYWTIGYPGSEEGVQRELEKHAFYEIPTMVSHTYDYYFPAHQDDRYPEHWPPKLGSEGFKNAVRQLQAKGIRIVPYVNGWVWDEDTESFRTKDAKNKGALWGPDGGLYTMTSYGGGQRLTGMCPASKLWRDEMLFMVQELVGRYGVDGVYFDFLSIHTSDCYNKDHGHAICGGNFWTKAVHELYEECRALAKELNPEAMITGEDIAEYCIDVHDTFLCMGKTGTNAPLFPAVYHGYANVFGGEQNKMSFVVLGRWWLLGAQNGWRGPEHGMTGRPPYEHWAPAGQYYKRLLKCRWEFATPYLGYGEMLRPPRIEGELPTITEQAGYGPFTVKTIEGSAWKAPDGSVGVFFLNYDDKNAHTFTWTTDLAEVAGLDASNKLRISRWKPEGGLETLRETAGGVLTKTVQAQPLDIIALKVEEIR